ncbi:MAG TPA: hypothetical protein VEQ10_02220, partial [Vicinamibacteria bacterium]|nr:hypothetical protein [Vicinamibacteria bacterium]
VGSTAIVGARLHGTVAGLHAGFVAGLSLLPFLYGRAASMDMLLAATVTTAVGLLALRLLGLSGQRTVLAAAAFAGLATLAKGPLGLLLPALVVGAWVLATGEWRFLREIASPWAVLVLVAIAAPWYLAISLDQGRRFLDVFILNHNLERFTSTVHHHAGPFWYYLPVLLVGLFPWSGLMVPGLVRTKPRTSRPDLLVLLWLVLPLVFFSLAGAKLPGYILPCVPPLAILMGRAADRLVTEGRTPERELSARVVGLVGLALSALVAAVPAWLFSVHDPAWPTAVPLAFWAVAIGLLVSRRLGQDPAGALQLWRVGAAGLLLLVLLAGPPIVARRESGRVFFKAAMGREVLAWGAWRTAWMAGYFYNDGRVREIFGVSELMAAVDRGPTLVLAGPGERRRLQAMGSLEMHTLVVGPRDNALLRLETRRSGKT